MMLRCLYALGRNGDIEGVNDVMNSFSTIRGAYIHIFKDIYGGLLLVLSSILLLYCPLKMSMNI